jgi:hypothetical protein
LPLQRVTETLTSGGVKPGERNSKNANVTLCKAGYIKKKAEVKQNENKEALFPLAACGGERY